ncbi:MAG: HEPN domain-containing protein [Candidatus Saccharicenans sp.]|nr:HEPN domain-containing protein [Candidatus Saccharicenans sp.]HOJ27110.1 HEPN domain-containing protein [Candidatus Saccharicenans sp.]HOL46380.1 HEPN domain-containing protein [Candidatus Saccharicenans sp.]HOP61458.1 HEPN domain-containing protein [Candidatus Saccharicenans sp.]HOT69458.1 HEPN domain-containing protein [Candidatus Saccharicenans sp.]
MNRWKDWYEQGKRDLEKARLDLDHGFYEWACFTAQQSAEKVIKAMAMKEGITLWGHSLTEMIDLLSRTMKIPEEIEEKARLLDLYYIPPRYPNGFASGKPADYFSEKQGREAINAANSIIRFCEGYLAR